MIAAWMAYALLASVLLAAAAYAVAEGARRLAVPTRWAWSAALVAMITLAAIAPLRARPNSASPLPVSFAPTRMPAATTSRRATAVERIDALRQQLAEATGRELAAVERALPPRADRWLGWMLLGASVLALGLLGAVHGRFAQLRRRWPTAVLEGARVRVAHDTGPAVIGVARPEIVVPAWLLERSAREQELVVAHEAEHVRGRDPLLLAAGCVAVALQPWNPAAWWMLSRLRLAVELDCDARVLRRGVAPRAYGSLLIDLAGRCSGFPAGAPALADTPSHLERRLVAMRPDRSRFPAVRAGAAGVLALVAILAACEARLPTSAEVRSMDVASAERGASQLQLRPSEDSLTTYYVNGVQVTAAQAHAIKGNRIMTVSVTKRADGGTQGSSVRITTLEGKDTLPLAPPVRGGSERTEVAGTSGGLQTLHDTFTGLVFVDGVRADISALRTLDPKQIATVNVLKGEAATRLYSDPAARNGVIQIVTVKGAKTK